MKGLKSLLSIETIISVAAVGIATYFVVEKYKENKKSSNEIFEEAVVVSTKPMEASPTKEDCESTIKYARMSAEAKEDYIKRCVGNKDFFKQKVNI